LAKVWNLPCVFVCENNGWAEATSSKWSVACGNVADRAGGFGMPGVTIDGHDFFAVYEAAGEAIERARAGGGPSLIECQVNRYYGHEEGDAQTYRDRKEMEIIRKTRDCIVNFTHRVTEMALVDPHALTAIDDEIATLIEDAVVYAKSSPEPGPEDLLTDVYISY
jgi:pyruvate dehydrogenase E1 component alpha subunit